MSIEHTYTLELTVEENRQSHQRATKEETDAIVKVFVGEALEHSNAYDITDVEILGPTDG